MNRPNNRCIMQQKLIVEATSLILNWCETRVGDPAMVFSRLPHDDRQIDQPRNASNMNYECCWFPILVPSTIYDAVRSTLPTLNQ
jgi:hypothetical protein